MLLATVNLAIDFELAAIQASFESFSASFAKGDWNEALDLCLNRSSKVAQVYLAITQKELVESIRRNGLNDNFITS